MKSIGIIGAMEVEISGLKEIRTSSVILRRFGRCYGFYGESLYGQQATEIE